MSERVLSPRPEVMVVEPNPSDEWIEEVRARFIDEHDEPRGDITASLRVTRWLEEPYPGAPFDELRETTIDEFEDRVSDGIVTRDGPITQAVFTGTISDLMRLPSYVDGEKRVVLQLVDVSVGMNNEQPAVLSNGTALVVLVKDIIDGQIKLTSVV